MIPCDHMIVFDHMIPCDHMILFDHMIPCDHMIAFDHMIPCDRMIPCDLGRKHVPRLLGSGEKQEPDIMLYPYNCNFKLYSMQYLLH